MSEEVGHQDFCGCDQSLLLSQALAPTYISHSSEVYNSCLNTFDFHWAPKV